MPTITMTMDQWIRDIVSLRERVKKLEHSRDMYAEQYLILKQQLHECEQGNEPQDPKEVP